MPTPISGQRTITFNEWLIWARHASLNLNVNVITSSYKGNCTGIGMPSNNQQIIKEILDNGTSIVYSGGNTNQPGSAFCNQSSNPNGYTPIYPFHPIYDSRIIIVTSSDINDNHNVGGGITHAHFPEVDISSPGFNVGIANAQSNPSSPVPHTYGSGSGSSYATPLVASIVSLVYSVNPCFYPEDIENIIKNTANTILDASSYPGLVGAGRINAFEAVKTAKNYGKYIPITTNTNWNSDTYMSGNLFIESGATLTIDNITR